MIGFFIFAFVLVLAFCTWFPDYVWLLKPIVVVVGVIWLVVKIIGLWAGSSKSDNSSIEDKWDEYDWWQDNQGFKK
ncbi:MAG: hypothetical protein MR019_03270 [Ruminococcus sp.]|nr:hypothetical protein [Ruminococcus sp.]MDY3895243.1 hypothetical protein [Candidatus Fimenecus sp.]